ncbi:MAG: hypothetical protein IKI97_12770 [Clostridia bacterium]|nr:hypothetical protein [Clostridia bacterium]
MSKKKITSFFGTVLTVLLFGALIVQSVFFISLVQGERDGSLPQFPEGEIKLLANEISDSSDSDTSFLFPYFVGVITSDGKYAGAYDDVSAREIFASFARVLEASAGGTAKKVVFSKPEKKYEYLDNLYNASDNCYYVKLRNGMEFSVLCQLMSDTYAKVPENPEFVISDMFLVGESSGEASIIAVDSYGNVLKIFPSVNVPFNNEYLQTYNNTVKEEFEFVRIEGNVQSDRNCYYPTYKYSINYTSALRRPFNESFDISVDSEDIGDFISVFGMNYDNTRFYRRSTDGAILCVEDTTSFEMTPDGTFSFSAGENGGKLSLFFENSEIVDYSFFDYVTVANKIVADINANRAESCAVLSLEDITYSAGECRFYYNYTINGIAIEQNNGYALELVFYADSLIYAQGKPEIVMQDKEYLTEIPQKAAYALMGKVSGPVFYFGPEYCFGETEEEQNRADIRWTVRAENNGRRDG